MWELHIELLHQRSLRRRGQSAEDLDGVNPRHSMQTSPRGMIGETATEMRGRQLRSCPHIRPVKCVTVAPQSRSYALGVMGSRLCLLKRQQDHLQTRSGQDEPLTRRRRSTFQSTPPRAAPHPTRPADMSRYSLLSGCRPEEEDR